MGNFDEATSHDWIAYQPEGLGEMRFRASEYALRARLDYLLTTIPGALQNWGRDGWLFTMDLKCPKCQGTNVPKAAPLVTLEKDKRGTWICCAICGHSEKQGA